MLAAWVTGCGRYWEYVGASDRKRVGASDRERVGASDGATGGGGGGEGGGGLGTHWKPLNTSKTLARAARWRRRRVGGQSADGGGDGEGLER